MRAIISTFTFLFCCRALGRCNEMTKRDERRAFVSALEEKMETKLQEYVTAATTWLEGVNDRHLAGSELGHWMNYNEIKPRLDAAGAHERGMKKMAMGMMPLVFHVGAASTWMLITSLMAAKSVAIGIVLLVFKIAVSSAKVASFFTALKSKQSDHHHHGWSWAPPHEHHGYDRSMAAVGPPLEHTLWAGGAAYETLPALEDDAPQHLR